MFCSWCGEKLSNDERFCPQCGSSTRNAIGKGVTPAATKDTRSPARCGATPLTVRNVGPTAENHSNPGIRPVDSPRPSYPQASKELGFMALDEFLVDEKVSAFKFENSYKVYDMNGNRVGAVQQARVSGGARAARILLGSDVQILQKFELIILSADGQRLGSVHRSGGAFSRIYVDDATGIRLADMKRRLSGFKDASGRTVCDVRIAGLTKRSITDTEGNTVAEIQHKWNGAKSLFTTADKYHVTISPSLTGSKRRLICSMALAYDLIMGD